MSFDCFGQIGVINSPPLTPDTIVQRIAGVGLETFNSELQCGNNSSGYFFGGSDGGFSMNQGVILTTGITSIAFSPNNIGNASIAVGSPGYAPLEELPFSWSEDGTFDACVLEFDFVPLGTQISLNYVFGSEEYPEWVGASFNDIFAILIEGGPEYPATMPIAQRNIAIIPGSPDPGVHATINNINQESYSEFYIDNTDSTLPTNNSIQYDGMTTKLTAIAEVTPCNTYHLTIAVADNSDEIHDSGIFIEENSLISNAPQPIVSLSNKLAENCGTATFYLSACFRSAKHTHYHLQWRKYGHLSVVIGGNSHIGRRL